MYYKFVTKILIFSVMISSLSFVNYWDPNFLDWRKIKNKVSFHLSLDKSNNYLIHLINSSEDKIYYYEIIEFGEREGFLAIAKAPSKYHHFDFFVIFNNELKIKYVDILQYRENWGYEISNKKWLHQFSKLTKNKFGSKNQVQAISGATISVNSLCNYIDTMLEELEYMK